MAQNLSLGRQLVQRLVVALCLAVVGVGVSRVGLGGWSGALAFLFGCLSVGAFLGGIGASARSSRAFVLLAIASAMVVLALQGGVDYWVRLTASILVLPMAALAFRFYRDDKGEGPGTARDHEGSPNVGQQSAAKGDHR